MKLFVCLAIFFTSLTAQAQELYEMPVVVSSRMSSFENLDGIRGNGGKTNKTAKGNAFQFIQPGETKSLLDIKSEGIIQRIWMTIDQNPTKLRSLRLQCYWDNDRKPAVDVPLGDFFCYNLGKPVVFQSEFFSSAEGRSFNCYIPMPFHRGAKILLINEGKETVKLFFDIDFVKKAVPATALYFHAYWSRQNNSKPGDDFVPLPKVNGRGRFLGMSVGLITDPAYKKSWWGEGEVKMFIDGDTDFPTIVGTGAEDYIGSAWGLGVFTERYQGCTIANDSTGLFNFYRWHVKDEIFFDKHLEVRLQQIGGWGKDELRKLYEQRVPLLPITVDAPGGFTRLLEMSNPPKITDTAFPDGWVNFYRADDYSAVSYFYLNKKSSNLDSLPAIGVRTAKLH